MAEKPIDVRPDQGRGARMKIEWSKKYIRDLSAGFNEFLGEDADTPGVKPCPELGEDLVRIHIPLRVPPEWWGCLIGDIVQNLRSALDLLACQLVLAGPKKRVVPTVNTGFPMRYDQKLWTDSMKKAAYPSV